MRLGRLEHLCRCNPYLSFADVIASDAILFVWSIGDLRVRLLIIEGKRQASSHYWTLAIQGVALACVFRAGVSSFCKLFYNSLSVSLSLSLELGGSCSIRGFGRLEARTRLQGMINYDVSKCADALNERRWNKCLHGIIGGQSALAFPLSGRAITGLHSTSKIQIHPYRPCALNNGAVV